MENYLSPECTGYKNLEWCKIGCLWRARVRMTHLVRVDTEDKSVTVAMPGSAWINRGPWGLCLLVYINIVLGRLGSKGYLKDNSISL
jgi:hypothetical protein